MAVGWQVQVSGKQQLFCSKDITGMLELGRQRTASEELFAPRFDHASGRWRLVLARLEENTVSRVHAVLEPRPQNRVSVRNESGTQSIWLADGGQVAPRQACELALPAALIIGDKTVRVTLVKPATMRPPVASEPAEPPPEESEGDDDEAPLLLQSLDHATLAPGAAPAPPPPKGNLDVEALARWFQAATDVLQSAASSLEFFRRAARAAVDLISLDSVQVLLLDAEGNWKVEAFESAQARPTRRAQHSTRILSRLLREKKTFWEVPRGVQDNTSLAGVNALVAAPILNRANEVIGALYGDRHQTDSSGAPRPITRLEALLVELLASGVAAGLARLEQEQEVLRARVQFEQFFTPELSRQLALQPDLLQGRDAEISVLFCDVRGFSRVSERLGPAKTVSWISDVMGALSDCVTAHKGVLVDYIGDELIAMWGAPETQPDAAQLACRAGLAMLEQLPVLNARWAATLGEPMSFGIGLNTGLARVGNTGSHRKFKYGPLGSTVNLASRVQGATKYLKVRFLITQATQAQLDDRFCSRRLCQVRVVNIKEAVTLYELVPAGQPNWGNLKGLYEEALTQFEAENFSQAARILGNLTAEDRTNGPALVLLARAVNCLIEKPDPFDAVWELPGK